VGPCDAASVVRDLFDGIGRADGVSGHDQNAVLDPVAKECATVACEHVLQVAT
jgi:hypothetical protein